MGSCSSSPVGVELKNGSKDLVGAVGRTSKIDIETIPSERTSMVAVEVLAGRLTIYRRKDIVYEPNGSLDYSKQEGLMYLRNLLDEPVGRFYLAEFCEKKEKNDMLKLVLLWKAIQKLDKGELSLKDTVDNNNSNGNYENPMDENEDEDSNEDKEKDDDMLNARMSSYKLMLQTKRADGDERIISEAKELVDTYLDKRAEQRVDFGKPEWNKLRDDVVLEAKKAIEAKDSSALRKFIFTEIQNAAIMAMVQGKLHKEFPLHSEFKRYNFKFKKVYNFISHWDFDFMQTLGKGSFGRVIRVRKKTTKRQYALKVMSKKKILSGAENSSQVTIERQVLVQCNCRYVVGVHFAFQTSRALFIALDLLEGGTLVEAMHNCGGKVPPDAVRIQAAQMILGLDHLHQHGILYRDLKPVNVMLDRRGNAVLTDMGLCAKFRPSIYERDEKEDEDGVKPMDILKPSELKCVGTYGYRAPEVLAVSSKSRKNKKKKKSNANKARDSQTETGTEQPQLENERKGYGTPVDYWALGVTMYYLLLAKYPFRQKAMRLNMVLPSGGMKATEEKLQQNVPNFKAEFEDQDLADVLEKLLLKDPEKRLDIDGCRSHPFFSSVDWEALEAGKVKPVYVPKVPKHSSSEKPRFNGLSDAMKQFAHENVLELFGGENDMQDEYRHVRSKHQKLFRDWDHIPDSLLKLDWDLLDKEDEIDNGEIIPEQEI